MHNAKRTTGSRSVSKIIKENHPKSQIYATGCPTKHDSW